VGNSIVKSSQALRTIELPKLELGCWHAWNTRASIPNSKLPGVYAIAVTMEDLDHHPVLWADVSYIGMTRSSGGLASRWRQFDKAIRESAYHSGGNTIRQQLGVYESWTHKLFVAAMAVECQPYELTPDDTLKLGWVGYLEYEAFAEFRRHSGSARRRPPFNKH
jgi:hypothetical protein